MFASSNYNEVLREHVRSTFRQRGHPITMVSFVNMFASSNYNEVLREHVRSTFRQRGHPITMGSFVNMFASTFHVFKVHPSSYPTKFANKAGRILRRLFATVPLVHWGSPKMINV